MIGARVLPPIAGSPFRRREPAAEIAITRVAFAALAAQGQFGGQPNLVAGAGTIDRLQDQFEIEGEFQFPDHHDRRIVVAQRHQIATADFTLDREAELFEEAFDGQIKRGFQDSSGGVGRLNILESNPDRPWRMQRDLILPRQSGYQQT